MIYFYDKQHLISLITYAWLSLLFWVIVALIPQATLFYSFSIEAHGLFWIHLKDASTLRAPQSLQVVRKGRTGALKFQSFRFLLGLQELSY
jgi:hypothetical protein